MLKNHIRENLNLNKIQLEKHAGIKVYYRKWGQYLNLALLLGFLFFFSIMLKELIKSYTSFYFLLLYAFFVYNLTEIIGRIILKNPIFILEGNRIYYLKTNCWYEVSEYKFEDKMDKRSLFCMLDRKGKIIFSENNRFLENTDRLKNQIKWIQLPEEQKEKIQQRRNRNL